MQDTDGLTAVGFAYLPRHKFGTFLFCENVKVIGPNFFRVISIFVTLLNADFDRKVPTKYFGIRQN